MNALPRLSDKTVFLYGIHITFVLVVLALSFMHGSPYWLRLIIAALTLFFLILAVLQALKECGCKEHS